ncbi:transmembrane protein 176 [Paramormyrops kingsleyae]|uniref:transmembrane protein 176 n=1 Tax=Paramormyrops kingsleyae TaxID=1676925 RepID=UPI000CD64B05|nr:membrane-spanning 4-domains subfamily A member 12-like isoform X1 [Paramormyrops kingsleyae]XP_023701161.1 membrane-spanning 4-domains subfamily A member 12-like isoform X1 [Paramormyrops kingsleyae]XP_023701162.1 membrane-spanning 4-domains subfamily A member 12-like isoform X1 [Paramormyrops kingsleyae]
MDVTVSRNLSVTVTDHSADKLRERQQKLRDRLQKVESKVLGVSQVMLGVMVISYSLPLHLTEYTEVMTFGVPWWSAIVFIVAGAVAIETGKLASMNSLRVCLLVTLVAVLTSTLALIFYSIDLHNNQDTDCAINSSAAPCGPQHYAKAFSRGVKSCLLVFTIIQAVISSTLSFFLYKERHTSTEYASLMENTPSTLIHSAPSDFN